MVSAWKAIARAEFLVRTSRIRRFRIVVLPVILTCVLGWALFIAPAIMNLIVGRFLVDFENILEIALPGLVRSMMFFLFMLVMVGPISNSLEEIRIGQWEILLSNNVKTRDMLVGSFLAKIPLFGLVIFIIAPILISPFAIVYNVSVLGLLIMYSILLSFAIVTLWISNILGTMIQSKLGHSHRGNDLAKGFSWIVIILIAIPGMALIYFMDTIATLMNLETFLLLPSTWSADLLTWTALLFSNSYIPASSLLNYESILSFPFFVPLCLNILLAIVVAGLGVRAADKLFTIKAGARTERIVSVRSENILFRGIRRLFPRRFGSLVVTSLKDFTRKMQNMSKLIYAFFITLIFPFLLQSGVFSDKISDPLFPAIMSMLITSVFLGIFSGITFGGVGFLDSKAQMWMLKSAPHGELRFIGARVISYVLLAIPLAIIPSTVYWLLIFQDISEYLMMIAQLLMVIISAIFIGIGVTSLNPSYEDTKSGAFTLNSIATIILILGSLFGGIFLGIPLLREAENVLFAIMYSSLLLPVVASCILCIGATRMFLHEG